MKLSSNFVCANCFEDPGLVSFIKENAVTDLPPVFVPPVMLVRQARGQGRQARGPQAAAIRVRFMGGLLV